MHLRRLRQARICAFQAHRPQTRLLPRLPCSEKSQGALRNVNGRTDSRKFRLSVTSALSGHCGRLACPRVSCGGAERSSDSALSPSRTGRPDTHDCRGARTGLRGSRNFQVKDAPNLLTYSAGSLGQGGALRRTKGKASARKPSPEAAPGPALDVVSRRLDRRSRGLRPAGMQR